MIHSAVQCGYEPLPRAASHPAAPSRPRTLQLHEHIREVLIELFIGAREQLQAVRLDDLEVLGRVNGPLVENAMNAMPEKLDNRIGRPLERNLRARRCLHPWQKVATNAVNLMGSAVNAVMVGADGRRFQKSCSKGVTAN